MKTIIKADKLGRICNITLGNKTPNEYKETLNMFRGQQLTKSTIKNCLDYLKLSVAKQYGDNEAEEKLQNLHYKWNNSWRFKEF